MTRSMTIVVTALAVILIVILGIVFYLVARDVLASNDQVEAPPTEHALAPTASPTSEANLPPPVVEVLPSDTPQPTATPAPTNTPAPTTTPLPTATTVIVPTNPPPPPPPPPPSPPPATEPPPPPPSDTRGLSAPHFALQDRSVFNVNGQIWFEFQVVNSTGGEVPYNMLGVMPKKDGADRLDWFKMSYGGGNATIKPEGLSWEDNMKLSERGNYTLRLAICFDGLAACQSGGGTWATLSHEIQVSIN